MLCRRGVKHTAAWLVIIIKTCFPCPNWLSSCGKSSRVLRGCGHGLTHCGVCLQLVLEAQRSPVAAMGSAKGKGHEGALESVTVKPATAVKPAANAVSVTSRLSAMPATWYVQVGSQKVWPPGGGTGTPAHPHPSLLCQLASGPVPAAPDQRSPTACSVRRAGPCTTSSVLVSRACLVWLGG